MTERPFSSVDEEERVLKEAQKSQAGRLFGARVVGNDSFEKLNPEQQGKAMEFAAARFEQNQGGRMKTWADRPPSFTERAVEQRGIEAERQAKMTPLEQVGPPPEQPTSNSPTQWRAYRRQMDAWKVERQAATEDMQMERQREIDQLNTRIQEGDFEARQDARVLESKEKDYVTELQKTAVQQTAGFIDELRQLGPTPDRDAVLELQLKYPYAAGDKGVSSILSTFNQVWEAQDRVGEANRTKELTEAESALKAIDSRKNSLRAKGVAEKEIRAAGDSIPALARLEGTVSAREAEEREARYESRSITRLEDDVRKLEATRNWFSENPTSDLAEKEKVEREYAVASRILADKRGAGAEEDVEIVELPSDRDEAAEILNGLPNNAMVRFPNGTEMRKEAIPTKSSSDQTPPSAGEKTSEQEDTRDIVVLPKDGKKWSEILDGLEDDDWVKTPNGELVQKGDITKPLTSSNAPTEKPFIYRVRSGKVEPPPSPQRGTQDTVTISTN
jgi:hypothetical protein